MGDGRRGETDVSENLRRQLHPRQSPEAGYSQPSIREWMNPHATITSRNAATARKAHGASLGGTMNHRDRGEPPHDEAEPVECREDVDVERGGEQVAVGSVSNSASTWTVWSCTSAK